jgi:L-lactate dehydrogenase complex protein LldG
MAHEKMSAREDILYAIRARRHARAEAHPPRWHQPAPARTLLEHFADRAGAAAAQVIQLPRVEEIPARVAEVLRARNMPAIVHLPPDPALQQFDWDTAPGLTLKRVPPGADDAALAIAPLGIAETGTLFYPASKARPASWHFRAGLEFAVIAADSIAPDLEAVLARIRADGTLPSTINLVTGPSRTGDIEQTLELGAHGPRELVILIVPSLGN